MELLCVPLFFWGGTSFVCPMPSYASCWILHTCHPQNCCFLASLVLTICLRLLNAKQSFVSLTLPNNFFLIEFFLKKKLKISHASVMFSSFLVPCFVQKVSECQHLFVSFTEQDNNCVCVCVCVLEFTYFYYFYIRFFGL